MWRPLSLSQQKSFSRLFDPSRQVKPVTAVILSAFNYLGLEWDALGRHNLNKMDKSLIVDMMDIKDARLTLQPDGFTQIQSDKDL